jgi:hypothetical protein
MGNISDRLPHSRKKSKWAWRCAGAETGATKVGNHKPAYILKRAKKNNLSVMKASPVDVNCVIF